MKNFCFVFLVFLVTNIIIVKAISCLECSVELERCVAACASDLPNLVPCTEKCQSDFQTCTDGCSIG